MWTSIFISSVLNFVRPTTTAHLAYLVKQTPTPTTKQTVIMFGSTGLLLSLYYCYTYETKKYEDFKAGSAVKVFFYDF